MWGQGHQGALSHSPADVGLPSFVMRNLLMSEYFKTTAAFNTATQTKPRFLRWRSAPTTCSKLNFIYGIDLRGPYNDVEMLLTMADLYFMEDLKDAIASQLAPTWTKTTSWKPTTLHAEKYTAPKLKETCSNFILTSKSIAKEGLGFDAATISKGRKDGRTVRDACLFKMDEFTENLSLVQHRTTWYSLVRPGTAWYSQVQPCIAWHSLV